MAQATFGPDATLLVAARGTGAEHGLWGFRHDGGRWHGRQLATVGQLSSLCRHPSLPVVYGTGSAGRELLAWRLSGGAATAIGRASTGDEPCHLAVDPSGRQLVAANYASGDLSVVALAADGGFAGPSTLLPLAGGGPDPERQEAAHPHQVLFHDGIAFVIDLGADLVRRFGFDAAATGEAVLRPLDDLATPAGTGPRHAVFLAGDRIAISDELSASLTIGVTTNPPGWTTVASSRLTGPGRTRHSRNYPGDIQRSADGAFVYLANRSHDSIAAFDVRGAAPILVAEVDSGAHWPQHLLVIDGHLVVAGWDSNTVTALPLDNGLPGRAEPLFDCAGAGWLTLFRP